MEEARIALVARQQRVDHHARLGQPPLRLGLRLVRGLSREGARRLVEARRRAPLRQVSLSVLLLAFAGVAFWAAVLAPAEGWSGGIPFVPSWVTVAIARGLAGLGVFLCLAMLVYGWKTGFRSAGEIVKERETRRPQEASRRGR